MLGYTFRRAFYMLITLILISMISFVVIQLPPGDYMTVYMRNLSAQGEQVTEAELAALEKRFGLDQPMYVQYWKWITGIVFHGDFGVSLTEQRSVRELLLERLGFTVMISFSTTLFVYVVAISLGIYSALHQYSIMDYFATFIGFVGMTVPGFLLALILMYIGMKYFGTQVGGLFSPKYELAPWSWGKFVDMLSNLWLPITVIGIGGTGRITRVMRATVLDELGKPYVMTARAKGLPERRLVLKYPVRIALSPILAGIGGVLPGLVGGGALVGIVLNLPTLGPLLNRALLSQDMYLAGSFIMIYGARTVVGLFISDLLLAWADPRIRLDQ